MGVCVGLIYKSKLQMKNIVCIYSITNKINNKKYIGSTTCFSRRKRTHLNLLRKNQHHSIKLQNSYNKYGESNFIFEVIEEVSNIEKLIEIEQIHIDKNKPDLNVTLIAGLNSHIGLKRTESTKEKIRLANTGKKCSDETKEKLRNINLGKKQSNETIQKKILSLKNSKKFQESLYSEERLKKVKETRMKNGGYVISEDQKKKISESLKLKKLQSAISKKICKFDLDFNLIETYPSMTKAEIDNGLKFGSLRYNISKMKKTIYKGFIWKILE